MPLLDGPVLFLLTDDQHITHSLLPAPDGPQHMLLFAVVLATVVMVMVPVGCLS